jgi:hypothetical protein
MHEKCPACGIRFEREQGYFFGAMYFSYALGVPIIVGLTALLKLTLLKNWELQWVVIPAWFIYLAMVPVVYRYSRILWMHFDRYFHPDEAPPGPDSD